MAEAEGRQHGHSSIKEPLLQSAPRNVRAVIQVTRDHAHVDARNDAKIPEGF